jgi:signal transduction histidine kinase
VADMLAVPLTREIAAAGAAYEARYRSSLLARQKHITWLSALIAIAIALSLAEIIVKLASNARALRQAGEELAEANRALDHERQRERRQNEMKTRFVSATSHEFRTPLTTIISSSQMLASYGERWDAERRMTHFQRISTAAHNMSQMLDEILLIGRAEMGALIPAPARLDLHDFCQSLIDNLSRACGQAHPLKYTYRGERWVHLDQRLLTHVLGNLVENALKYSEAGTEVGVHVAVQTGGVRCVVQDCGIGIAEEDLPLLFDSFHRGRNVGTVAGSGLGMAAAKRALDVQQGTIEVRSERGHGTEVTVFIPLLPGGDDEAQSEGDGAASDRVSNGGAPSGETPRDGALAADSAPADGPARVNALIATTRW